MCGKVIGQEGNALGVAAVPDGDVHRAALVDGVIVHWSCALVRMHMACPNTPSELHFCASRMHKKPTSRELVVLMPHHLFLLCWECGRHSKEQWMRKHVIIHR